MAQLEEFNLFNAEKLYEARMKLLVRWLPLDQWDIENGPPAQCRAIWDMADHSFNHLQELESEHEPYFEYILLDADGYRIG